MIAGVELDLGQAWAHRRESGITAVLALGTPLLFGCAEALGMLLFDGWMRGDAKPWLFVVRGRSVRRHSASDFHTVDGTIG